MDSSQLNTPGKLHLRLLCFILPCLRPVHILTCYHHASVKGCLQATILAFKGRNQPSKLQSPVLRVLCKLPSPPLTCICGVAPRSKLLPHHTSQKRPVTFHPKLESQSLHTLENTFVYSTTISQPPLLLLLYHSLLRAVLGWILFLSEPHFPSTLRRISFGLRSVHLIKAIFPTSTSEFLTCFCQKSTCGF